MATFSCRSSTECLSAAGRSRFVSPWGGICTGLIGGRVASVPENLVWRALGTLGGPQGTGVRGVRNGREDIGLLRDPSQPCQSACLHYQTASTAVPRGARPEPGHAGKGGQGWKAVSALGGCATDRRRVVSIHTAWLCVWAWYHAVLST